MQKFWTKEFPTFLKSHDLYIDLSETQVSRLYARLSHIEEICTEIKQWLNLKKDDLSGPNQVLDFLENIELDVAIVQAQDKSEGNNAITSWLIHSTWLNEVPKYQLRNSVSPELKLIIELPQFSLDIGLSDFRIWLSKKNEGLECALALIFSGLSLSDVLTGFLTLDILLTDILLGLNKWRLTNIE